MGRRRILGGFNMTIATDRGDVNRLMLFRRPRLDNSPKSRRLQFMKTRFMRLTCVGCGKLAHYRVTLPRKKSWCKGCFPEEMRMKLDIGYQFVTYIMPLGDYLDGHRY